MHLLSRCAFCSPSILLPYLKYLAIKVTTGRPFCGAGVLSVAEAEAEVAAAERTAAAAALRAAQLAASAGLDYAAPAGVAVDLSGIEKARAPATYSFISQDQAMCRYGELQPRRGMMLCSWPRWLGFHNAVPAGVVVPLRSIETACMFRTLSAM